MVNVISTVMTYPLNGSTVDFAIPFEYLARKFVKVTLVGTNRQELVLNQDYRFTTRTQITTTRAWGTGGGYDLIEIRRYTSATDRLVDFADGSILRAYDLNISQVQTLHVAEEARDLTADTIGVNNDGNLDSRGRRIVNVVDGIDAGDVVTVRQQQAWADSALNQANRAKTEADKAKTEADRATAQATVSSSAASAALVSEGKAKTSEDNAKDSELRAIIEADKLGNMNDLADSISSIDTVTHNVTFKGKISVGSNGSSTFDVVTFGQLSSRDASISTLQSKVTSLESKVVTLENKVETLENGISTTPWINLPLTAGWTPISGYRAVYRKVNGMVYLELAVAGGTFSAGSVVFTLPAGYRPSTLLIIQVVAIALNGYELPRLIISTDGVARLYGTVNGPNLSVNSLFAAYN